MNLPIRLRCNDIFTSAPLDIALLVWGVLAFAATPLLMVRSSPMAGGVPDWVVLLCGGVIGTLMILACLPMAKKVKDRLSSLPPIWWALLAGALLRLAWFVAFPSTPQSDSKTYLALATALAHGQPYKIAGTLAYWPVGYPLWLAGWLSFFDVKSAVLLSQFVAYLLGFGGIYLLARHLGGATAARIGAWSFALWPNLLAQVATPEKESLVMALLPWVLLAALQAAPKWSALVAGAALGFAILVQPSLQFLLPLLVILFWCRLPSRPFAMATLLLILGAAAVVLPWTIRNASVLGAPVLVSTNGGDNLYRANNPHATGGYTDAGEHDLSSLAELERDRQGKKLALKWMMENPLDFVALGFEKQLRFMGDDSPTIYASLQRGEGTNNVLVYIFFKVFANLWWLLVWMLLATAAMANRTKGSRDERWLIWSWAYLFVLHTIFESASKYHLPMIWVLCVLLGCVLVRPVVAAEK